MTLFIIGIFAVYNMHAQKIICGLPGHLSLDCVPNDDESGLADEVTNWHRNILCDILAHNLQIIQIYISC